MCEVVARCPGAHDKLPHGYHRCEVCGGAIFVDACWSGRCENLLEEYEHSPERCITDEFALWVEFTRRVEAK